MITEEQRELRRRYIGSSDSAAILGLDPFRSPADVWMEKTGQVDPFAGNAHTDRGNILEPVILAWAARELKVAIVNDRFVTNPDYPRLCANLDAVIASESAIVEAKSAVDSAEWGQPGTDEVPNRVNVQVHHQMLVLGDAWRVAYVPVLLPGYRSFDFRIYRVDRNDRLARAIGELGEQFWTEHVSTGVRPEDFRPSIEVLKRVRREPNKTVSLDAGLMDRLSLAREACRAAADVKEEAERAVLTALADAEAGDCGDGRSVTYLETTRKGYTVQDSTFRQLRVRPAKEKR